jgi:uncharacterized protein
MCNSTRSGSVAHASTPDVQVRRKPQRAAYDHESILSILDATALCHLGFVANDRPVVVPTLFGHDGEFVYLHASAAGRLAKVASGAQVSVAVTILDGLVLARSAMHHSANYRSVVLLGELEAVTDPDVKVEALRVIVDHVVPGRWAELRPPTTAEVRATAVARLPIAEASAKIRTGPPSDDEADLGLRTWAGVVPLREVAGPPEPAPDLVEGVSLDASVKALVGA